MAENKKSVLLYCDIIHTVEELDDADAGLLFKHYLRYINDQNPEPPSKLIKIVFEPIKQNLKRDLKKWKDTLQSRSIAGKAGAEARWQKIASDGKRIEGMAKMAVKEIVTVNVTDTVNDNVKERTLDWFKKQIDPIFLENLKMSQKGKDIDQAIKESYAHMAADPARLACADSSDCKKLLNTWLSNIKNDGNRNGFKTRANETVPTFSGDYSSKL
jgi:hypothetical protein